MKILVNSSLILCLSIFSASGFANPCGYFVDQEDIDFVNPMRIDEKTCLIDKHFLSYLKFDKQQNLTHEKFGEIILLSNDGEHFAVIADILHLLHGEIGEIRPNVAAISVAIGACIRNPACRRIVVREARRVARNVGGWMAGGYFWDKFKERFKKE